MEQHPLAITCHPRAFLPLNCENFEFLKGVGLKRLKILCVTYTSRIVKTDNSLTYP